MIRWLFIDIDDTVCNSTVAYAHALKACTKVFRRSYPGVRAARFEAAYEKARRLVHRRLTGTAAMHDRALYFVEACRLLKLPYRPRVITELTTTYWRATYQHLKLYPGVRRTLQTIRRRGLKIGVVSDLLEEVQEEKLKRLGLSPYVEFLITSEAVGHEKPNPAIFRAALARARAKPSQVIMVGDSYSRDVQGAKRLGLTTVLVGRGAKRRADVVLPHFSALEPWLKHFLSTTS